MINRCIRIRACCSVFAVWPIITFFNFDELKFFDRSFRTLVSISLSYLQIFDVKNHYWLKTDPITTGRHYTTRGRINALLKDSVTKVIFFPASLSKPKDTTANSITMGTVWICHN